MDILAHGLWAGIALTAAARQRSISRATIGMTVGLAIAPDLVQMLPVIAAAAIHADGLGLLKAYVTALPGFEPDLPPRAAWLTHHLHCALHSAVVAAAATLAVWLVRRALWLPLLGWWSHIVIDVFTHSAEFYPVPVLYPFTERGFDGIAWNTPWFMATNYIAIAISVLVLWWTRRSAPVG